MNPFPSFFVCYRKSQRYWQVVEEHVTVILPGDRYSRPTFKVTDEHRKRWPGYYAAFRDSLSVRARLRLWWWRKIAKPDRKPVFDEDQTPRFNEFIGTAIQPRTAADNTVDADIRAAIEQHKDK